MIGYDGWWSVPEHMLTKTGLADLEYPRTAKGVAYAAVVDVKDGPLGGRDSHLLWRVSECPPTSSSALQLLAAAGRSGQGKPRVCGECGAWCQRPLPVVDGRALCVACRHIARLRAAQARLAEVRAALGEDVGRLLDEDQAVVVQVDPHTPPATDSGRARPATAARVRVAGLDLRRLADVTVRLAGPRARWVPEDAVDPVTGAEALRTVLAGRRLVAWTRDELLLLRTKVVPGLGFSLDHGDPWHPEWGGPDVGRDHVAERRAQTPTVAVSVFAGAWRGQLDPRTRRVVECLAPGSPDRLALMLHRMGGRAPLPV